MSERTLLSVGYEIPGRSEDHLAFDSHRSLLDADVILFSPTFREFKPQEFYRGKPCLDDHDSATVLEQVQRWQDELKEALKAGKTVFVFLPAYEEIYVATGQKGYSGTGRNQKVTRYVNPVNNYQALPFDLGTINPKGGSSIKVATDLKHLAPYWKHYGPLSTYEVYLHNPKGTAILTASSPDAVVGLIVKTGKGTAILLPPVNYDEDEFTQKNSKKVEEWTDEGVVFGNRLVGALLEIDRAVRAESDITPAPDWATSTNYALSKESAFEAELASTEAEIERLRGERAAIETKISDAASLRDLLYETGRPLERAILKALKLMGFTAAPFKDDGSEFDAVFEAPEGRFLGEAEGKNDRAVSIEKLDQLERNIREDFDRENTGIYAKAVLFGNAYRLTEPKSRQDFFTAKCYAGAKRGKVALVRTPDLFEIARYLDEHDDPTFAAVCRNAIVKAEGEVVTFPPVPSQADPEVVKAK